MNSWWPFAGLSEDLKIVMDQIRNSLWGFLRIWRQKIVCPSYLSVCCGPRPTAVNSIMDAGQLVCDAVHLAKQSIYSPLIFCINITNDIAPGCCSTVRPYHDATFELDGHNRRLEACLDDVSRHYNALTPRFTSPTFK
jgi:hypothetical protein